jgi:MoaA/NifB/PqqE/SkfB family radical SAM enzyme
MLTLHYRGRLASCNYACSYCPFAKRRDTRATLRQDAEDLQRFVDWVGAQSLAPFSGMRVMFTPWGEALIRRHYQQAMLRLAAMPHIAQVSAQTNLSGPLTWLASAPSDKLSLWCTFHPSQTSTERFVSRSKTLDDLGIRHSVGVVAMPAHYAAIRELRSALPARVPMWLNAYDRRGPGYYSAEDLRWLESIDPFFHHNHSPGHSRGAPCRAGEEAVMVDGEGTVQRCHFIPTKLGNLYTDALPAMLKERACSRFKCDCFVGYAQRKDRPFEAAFGHGLPARIPLHVA